MGRCLSTEHGAATIVSGICSGKGAVFGVSLKTSVVCSPSGSFRWNTNMPEADDELVRECLAFARRSGWVKSPVSIRIETEIPPSRGMKSSSSVSLALIRSLGCIGGVHIPDTKLLSLSSSISMKAGVSLTGAYDDASGCHYGGIVFADNMRRRVIRRTAFSGKHAVFFVFDNRRIEKRALPAEELRRNRGTMNSIFRTALSGRIREACIANTMLLCSMLNIDPAPAFDALGAGALLAGLSGTGPAFFALCDSGQRERVLRTLRRYGTVIETQTRGVSRDGIAL